MKKKEAMRILRWVAEGCNFENGKSSAAAYAARVAIDQPILVDRFISTLSNLLETLEDQDISQSAAAAAVEAAVLGDSAWALDLIKQRDERPV